MPDSTVPLATGVTLSVFAQGDPADPAVVLLPGPTDSWRSYAPVLDHLPARVRAIAVSQRGHGDSDKPATGYGVGDYAADVPALLDALGIDRAVLVGHSGSCLTARRVALDHPERVAGLVLEASPTTLRGNAALESFRTNVLAGLADPVDPAFARSFVTGTSSDRVPPALLDMLAAEVAKVPARVWHETFAGLASYDDTADLGRVAAPVLLVWGDDDPIVGREMQEALAASLRADLRVYPGAGHTPRWEEPATFAADLAAFA